MVDLEALVARIRRHPGLTDKRHLESVARLIGGDGGDAAVLAMDDEDLVLAAEAIVPELVSSAPRVAGIAAVVATLNDLAATGAEPVAILDTVVGSAETVEAALDGISVAGSLYDVPVVGGHTTISTVGEAVSVFGLGRTAAPLGIDRAQPGDTLIVIACTEGELIANSGAMPFFSHLRGPRRARAATDLRLLHEAACEGEIRAARDVSMPGLAGSLIQMLEGTGLGCALQVESVPRPEGVALQDWLTAFLSYGFLVVGEPQAILDRFTTAGIAAAVVGGLDESTRVSLAAGGEERLLWDLGAEPLTGFTP